MKMLVTMFYIIIIIRRFIIKTASNICDYSEDTKVLFIYRREPNLHK